MSKIKLTLPDNEPVVSGKQVTFTAPCDCSVASCIQINGVDYDIVDSTGSAVTGTGAWDTGALVTVLLDTSSHNAYILNSAAAPKSHKHSASDINSGTLPVARGGTGVTSLSGTTSVASKMFSNNLGSTMTSVSGHSIPILGTGWDNNGYVAPAALRDAMGLGKTTGALPVANGGTGKASVTSGSFLVGNGTNAMTEKTPSQVRTAIGAATTVSFSDVQVTGTWTLDSTSGYYTQTVSVSGITESDSPIADIVLRNESAANVAFLDAWSKIERIVTSANSITLYAKETPASNFILQLKVVR